MKTIILIFISLNSVAWACGLSEIKRSKIIISSILDKKNDFPADGIIRNISRESNSISIQFDYADKTFENNYKFFIKSNCYIDIEKINSIRI